ncbi:DUF58 domain-containing protein [Arenimonas oryziterrae]|uniref:DUF58 domain-containing protein n=1 Tax=Arenimonas oryziterrae DSM 21050 = YC6267 TaxID=1121015 RepID=A0A091AV24_9GAMM|nr:DUF58 domain-containing protein [Arenimonas oryziterrae]KFN44143.1 hypothetical protein N789_06925 [Arenimonas oryziterrae DSM 21050 = YC6267]
MRPSPALVWASALLALLGVAVALGLVPAAAWWISAGTVLVLAVLDALELSRRPTPSVERELPSVLPLGPEREVLLRLRTSARFGQRVSVHDLHPGPWPVRGLPRALTLHAGKESSFAYHLLPMARGAFVFAGCHLRLWSALRLWTQQRTLPVSSTVKVYPNFAPLAKFALFSAEQASRMVGAHLQRRRGEGTDFHQMREYRIGDSLRQIDWKATSRAHRLISREYQEERNQQVVILLDTGRRMLARDDRIAHFDHVLNASLVLSYLALRQGDAVGLMAHGGPARWLPPMRGLGTIDALMGTVYDLEAQPVATDYLAAATQLSLRQKRRALVMLITNGRDEDIEDLLAAVKLLQRKHLVCVASLREQALDESLTTPVVDLTGAIRVGAVANYLDERRRAHDALRQHGVTVLDVTCPELPGALVERYLAIKRQGRL